MANTALSTALQQLSRSLAGQVLVDEVSRMAYATDASVYQELPLAVVCPRTDEDVRIVLEFALAHSVGLIPRAAGTSLAGQVVGSGMVVDVSRYMNAVINVDPRERTVRVQPGVIRDELNRELAGHGLLFGPETATSNRATIGGMLGNNSCGANSIHYGGMRDQVLEVTGYTGAGQRITLVEVESAAASVPQVVRETIALLADPQLQKEIRERFPEPSVVRRNTGYALDRLLDSQWFGGGGGPLNPCHLIAGSEGTLMLATEIKLRCHELPPAELALFCPHFSAVSDALRATQLVMEFPRNAGVDLFACELIDHWVLEGAGRNLQQRKNLQFVEGNPQAILIVEVRAGNRQAIREYCDSLARELAKRQLGESYPVYFDAAVPPIWQVRQAGLGVVASVTGDAKPQTLIEDAAVSLRNLPDYIADVGKILQTLQIQCVHYGHAGAGEIHLRPVINLKTQAGRQQFRAIAEQVAALVRRYRGSLSGEHGDGRLRGEFLPLMIGAANYEVLRKVKAIWDPQHILNPGKIVDPPRMDQQLRVPLAKPATQIPTMLDFQDVGGLQGAAEMCSGVGACRKTASSGGVMCPSYMATREEKDTTRARANLLRQVLTDHDALQALADERLHEVMDLCLSCKGCKSECPTNVDMAKMKAELLYHYYRQHGVPRRARWFADFAKIHQRLGRLAWLGNRVSSHRWAGRALKGFLGIHPQRSLPRVSQPSLRAWFKNRRAAGSSARWGPVMLFCDEFTNSIDVSVGQAAVQLLEHLGFEVRIPEHSESGRAAISNGLLDRAKQCATENVETFSRLLKTHPLPIIGIEPSALLSFRDEYPCLVDDSLKPQARQLAEHVLLIDEFISRQMQSGQIESRQFSEERRKIRLHAHCHQRVLSSLKPTIRMLQLPRNYQVQVIPAGCCGMAGSFGYEREHYEISMNIGELVLFPTIRNEPASTLIAAGGTSCRHQILDGTGRRAWHPVEILSRAVRP